MTDAHENEPPARTEGCSQAKAQGALIALAAGDSLGWPQESPRRTLDRREPARPSIGFRQWMRRAGGQHYPHEEAVLRGEYSDDTQLALAVARARTVSGSGWWAVLTRTELPLWTLYERGGGGATKRAARSWAKGSAPWTGNAGLVDRYFGAGGNGVAMRVLPHAIYFSGAENPAPMLRDVVSDGVSTHGHPRALVGATVLAYAAWWLLRARHTLRFGELVEAVSDGIDAWGRLPASTHSHRGWTEAAERQFRGGYAAVWQRTVEEMRQLLEIAARGLADGAIADDDRVLRDLGCFGEAKGSGTVGAAAAVYLCARFAPQPVQGVLKAAFAHGADTDTVAAMTGSLMGSLAGSDWLPTDWYAVQDCDYLRRVANRLARGPSAAADRPPRLRSVTERDLDGLMHPLVEGYRGSLVLDGTRSAAVVDVVSLKPLSRTTTARRWELRISDGQTVYVTKVGRKPKQADTAATGTAPWTVARTSEAPLSAAVVGVKLSVRDVLQTSKFYEEVLGIEPEERTSRLVSFGMLTLVEEEHDRKARDDEIGIAPGAGRHRLLVRVSDLRHAYERVKAAEHTAHPIASIRQGERTFRCRDPEGNLLEVAERR